MTPLNRVKQERDQAQAEIARLRDIIDKQCNQLSAFTSETMPEKVARLRRQLDAECESRREGNIEIARLREELAKVKEINRIACLDWADDDTRVKEMAKKFYPAAEVDGDSYGVPGVVDIVEWLIDDLAKARGSLRACIDRLENPGPNALAELAIAEEARQALKDGK